MERGRDSGFATKLRFSLVHTVKGAGPQLPSKCSRIQVRKNARFFPYEFHPLTGPD